MANSIVRLPLGYFPDPNKGRPLFNASIYVGEPDLDPRIPANQKTVTGRQENGTEIPLDQPIATSAGGVPVDSNGNYVTLLVDGAYSMAVDDKNDNQVYYFANVLDGAPVTFNDNPVLYRVSVDAAKSDLGLSVGQYIRTTGYYSSDDGGAAFYTIRDSSYIPLAGDHEMDNGNYMELELEAVNDVRKWGARGEFGPPRDTIPTVDSATEIQNAFDRVKESGASIEGSASLVFGVSSPLVFSANDSSLIGLNLTAIGAGWDNTKIVLTFGEDSSEKQVINSSDCHVNANHLAGGGIYYNGVRKSLVSHNTVIRSTVYQQRIGNKDLGDSSSCTDTMFLDLHGSEWLFGEGAGETDYSQRTSYGLWVDSADASITGGVFNNCLKNGYYDTFFNNITTGTHFWSGSVRTDPAVVSLEVSSNAVTYSFNGCRVDDGAILIKGFKGLFVGCFQIQFTHRALQFETENVGETLSSFVMANHRIAGSINDPKFTGVAGGSFDSFKGSVSNVVLQDGSYAKFLGITTTLSDSVNAVENGIKIGDQESTPIGGSFPAVVSKRSNGIIGVHSIATNNGDFGPPSFLGAKARSEDLTSQPLSGDILCAFKGYGSNGTDFSSNDTGIECYAAEDWTPTAMGAAIKVRITPNGSQSAEDGYYFFGGAFAPATDNTKTLGSLSNNWSSVHGYEFVFQNNRKILSGIGSPEGVITANRGSMYLNETGGAGTTLYIKESGTGNTGWVAK